MKNEIILSKKDVCCAYGIKYMIEKYKIKFASDDILDTFIWECAGASSAKHTGTYDRKGMLKYIRGDKR